jgi:tetratricopeptide (TPR) repeat protein
MILGLLLGAGVEVALGRAVETIAGYLRQDKLGRLLLLIQDEFGEEMDLDVSAVLSWRTDDVLATRLLAAAESVPGELSNPSALAEVIRPHLVHSEPPQADDLSGRIADAAREFGPLIVREPPDIAVLLGNRADSHHAEQMDALGTIERLFRVQAGEHEESPGEALLRGPLEHADARDLVERSQQLAETDPAGGGELLLQAADRLDAKGLGPIAETYRARAGELLLTADETTAGAEAFVAAARGQLKRGSSQARMTLSTFSRLAGGEQAWMVRALQARLGWIVAAAEARDAFREAVDHSDGDPAWLADYGDLLVLVEQWPEILEVTAEVGTDVADEDVALRLELARAEAHSATGEADADSNWHRLLERIDREMGDAAAGLAWQRRALRLAYDDRGDEARAAYRSAMQRWSRISGHEEQMADAFYGMISAAASAGLMVQDQDLMPLAAEMRGLPSVDAARAGRLEYRAMSRRLAGQLPDALENYGQALWIHRLSGSLSGVLSLRERIGELLEEAGRAQQAIAHYLRAGQTKRALGLVQALPAAEIEAVLRLESPVWERVGVYAVLEKIGRSISAAFVAAHLERMLEDARSDAPVWLGPNARFAAREALATVSIQAPAARRPELLEILKEDFAASLPAGRQAAGFGLVLGTNAGHWDETELLVEGFLSEHQFSGVASGWVAERAHESQQIFETLVTAAKDGSEIALEVLGMLEPDHPVVPAVTELANEKLEKLGSLKAVKRSGRETSVGFGMNLGRYGLIGSVADESHRRKLTEVLLNVALDDEEPEEHRATALAAIYNMAAGLQAGTVRRVLGTIKPLCFGRYGESEWDELQGDDPLSRFRVGLHTPNALRAMAIQLAGRLEKQLGQSDGRYAARAVEEALRGQDSILLRGGLEAVSDTAVDVPPDAVERLLGDEDIRVRAAAIKATVSLGRATDEIIEKAAADVSPIVRQVLLDIEEPAESRKLARELLGRDPDAYLRAMAEPKPSS